MQSHFAPEISVIVPVYNRAGYLHEALASIASQNYPSLEVLVVDDGSTDNSGAVALACAAKYPDLHLRYIRQDHEGISKSRNRGIRESSGQWIAFLDSDDVWKEDKIVKQTSLLAVHPECRIVFSRYQNFWDSSAPSQPTEAAVDLFHEYEDRNLASALVHKSLFDQCGLFSENLDRGEDSEWVARIKVLGIDISQCIEEPLYRRRIHDGNISQKNRFNDRKRIADLLVLAIRNAQKVKRAKNVNLRTDSSL